MYDRNNNKIHRKWYEQIAEWLGWYETGQGYETTFNWQTWVLFVLGWIVMIIFALNGYFLPKLAITYVLVSILVICVLGFLYYCRAIYRNIKKIIRRSG